MYYDLIQYPNLASKVELIGARLFQKSLNWRTLISKVLERFRITLRYKYAQISDLSSKPQSPFHLDKTYFVQRAGVSNIRKENLPRGRFADLVSVNFFHEKASLFHLLNLCTLGFPSINNASSELMTKYTLLVKKYFSEHEVAILLPEKQHVDFSKFIEQL